MADRSPRWRDRYYKPVLLTLTIISIVATITGIHYLTAADPYTPLAALPLIVGVYSFMLCPPFLLLYYGYQRNFLITGLLSLVYGSLWVLMFAEASFFLPVVRGWMVGLLFYLYSLASLLLYYYFKRKQSVMYPILKRLLVYFLMFNSLLILSLLIRVFWSLAS